MQSILFDRTKWTAKKARNWLNKYNVIPIKRVHATKKFYRYRLRTPNKNLYYHRTISVPSDNLKIIMQYRKKPKK